MAAVALVTLPGILAGENRAGKPTTISPSSSPPKSQNTQEPTPDPTPKPTLGPTPGRKEALDACLQDLDVHDAQETTKTWVVSGPGSAIDIPNPCNWGDELPELLSLILIGDALNVMDASWYSSTAINRIEPVCSWKHIDCNLMRTNVTGVVLGDSKLNGTIPTFQLQAVTRLFLYRNDGLTGTIPSSMFGMTQLEALYLQETSLEGSISSNFAHLVNLQELFFDRTNIRGEVPLEICSLPKLRSLHADCKGGGQVSCSCCTSCK